MPAKKQESRANTLFRNEYAFGATMLRYAFGILFLLVAIKKFRMGYMGFAEALVNGEGALAQDVPDMILYLYGLLLPAAEVVAGVLLLANRYVKEAYTLIGIMYLSFIFGQQYDGNTSKVSTEYLPALLALSFAVFFEIRAFKKK